MPLAPNCQIMSWQKTQFASQLVVQKRIDNICEVKGRPMQSNRTERHLFLVGPVGILVEWIAPQNPRLSYISLLRATKCF